MAATDYRIASSARVGAPGVYLEEIMPESPPVFRTGVPVFVGFVQENGSGNEWREEEKRPCALTHWEQFRERVGQPVRGGVLEYVVRGFFEKGSGGLLWCLLA